MPTRCTWAEHSDLMRDYHDREWGVPHHDERKLLELLILGGAQAGLSWSTILNKRENYRVAFDHFDAEKIARYGSKQIARLLANPGIVRNRLKIESAVANARAFLDIRDRCGSFDTYIWSFVDGRPRVNAWKSRSRVPASSKQSDAMSKALRQEGFKFVGTTICYAFMQTAGLVNDHVVGCCRYDKCSAR